MSKSISIGFVAVLLTAALAFFLTASAAEANIYVSTAGDDTHDGSAPDAEHALLTVEAGVAKAREYMLANPDSTVTVNVGEGTFALTSGLRLVARSSLKGAGRNLTILEMKNLNTTSAPGGAAIVATNALSSIRSLTVTNGSTAAVSDKNVRGITMKYGTVSDCHVTGVRTKLTGGGIYLETGTVTNCVIDHCTSDDIYKYGGGCAVASGGLVVDSELYANCTGNQWYGNTGGRRGQS